MSRKGHRLLALCGVTRWEGNWRFSLALRLPILFFRQLLPNLSPHFQWHCRAPRWVRLIPNRREQRRRGEWARSPRQGRRLANDGIRIEPATAADLVALSLHRRTRRIAICGASLVTHKLGQSNLSATGRRNSVFLNPKTFRPCAALKWARSLTAERAIAERPESSCPVPLDPILRFSDGNACRGLSGRQGRRWFIPRR
jgi:hypothetical protein